VANPYIDASGVYCNKLGITDAAQLKQVEYDITAVRSREILKQHALAHIQGFGLARQQAIHQHLFQDVYDWAGKTRTVPSSKRMANGMVSVFADPDTFAAGWQALEKKTHAFANAKNLTFGEKRAALVDIFIEANHIHPFPEGNGRSLQVFMKQLAHMQGVALDYTKTNAQAWNMASALSGTHGELFEHSYLIPNPPDPAPIRKIFAAMASPLRESDVSSQRTQAL
jgi:cell filamentation protein